MLRQNANDCSLFDSAKLLKVTEMQQDFLNPELNKELSIEKHIEMILKKPNSDVKD